MNDLRIAVAGGLLDSNFPDPVESYGFLIPSKFRTFFLIENESYDSRWSIELDVRVQRTGTPQAHEVIVRGNTKSKIIHEGFRPYLDSAHVETWQLDQARKSLNDLLIVSIIYAIEYFRYEGSLENWSIPLRVNTDQLLSGKWELASKGFENTSSKAIRKRLEKHLDRRALSQEDHLKCAELVQGEVERAKATKTRAKQSVVVASFFGLDISGAEYRIRQAKKLGFLTKNNRVSAKYAERKGRQ